MISCLSIHKRMLLCVQFLYYIVYHCAVLSQRNSDCRCRCMFYIWIWMLFNMLYFISFPRIVHIRSHLHVLVGYFVLLIFRFSHHSACFTIKCILSLFFFVLHFIKIKILLFVLFHIWTYCYIVNMVKFKREKCLL